MVSAQEKPHLSSLRIKIFMFYVQAADFPKELQRLTTLCFFSPFFLFYLNKLMWLRRLCLARGHDASHRIDAIGFFSKIMFTFHTWGRNLSPDGHSCNTLRQIRNLAYVFFHYAVSGVLLQMGSLCFPPPVCKAGGPVPIPTVRA